MNDKALNLQKINDDDPRLTAKIVTKKTNCSSRFLMSSLLSSDKVSYVAVHPWVCVPRKCEFVRYSPIKSLMHLLFEGIPHGVYRVNSVV